MKVIGKSNDKWLGYQKDSPFRWIMFLKDDRKLWDDCSSYNECIVAVSEYLYRQIEIKNSEMFSYFINSKIKMYNRSKLIIECSGFDIYGILHNFYISKSIEIGPKFNREYIFDGRLMAPEIPHFSERDLYNGDVVCYGDNDKSPEDDGAPWLR